MEPENHLERGSQFLRRNWELIVAAEFLTIEVWTRKGLQRFVVLFFSEISTARSRSPASRRPRTDYG